jgi:hypothetical protein
VLVGGSVQTYIDGIAEWGDGWVERDVVSSLVVVCCGGSYMCCLFCQVFGLSFCLPPNGSLPSVVCFGCEACLAAAGDALVGQVFEGGTQRGCW